MKTLFTYSIIFVAVFSFCTIAGTYPVIDTDQSKCFGNVDSMTFPISGQSFYGQDAQYNGIQPSYRDNGDGTVSDLATGLMWQQDPGSTKFTYVQAAAGAATFNLAGHNDWRLPTIKELYSLILFSGTDISGEPTENMTPFIDTNYFVFAYGNTNVGERLIDAQYASSTLYVGNGSNSLFGVNFADGRIKGYGLTVGGSDKTFFVMYVRGVTNYGINNFVDNGNNTIIDSATGLMWQKNDSGITQSWQQALKYCEELDFAGHDDWRLPNAKELQSIIDYSRSPDTTDSAAIDPIFNASQITDEGDRANFPFYWTSSTHEKWNGKGGTATYLAFGEALGWMEQPPKSGNWVLLDVHGAGAQRSDPKTGNPANYPHGHGPQGDVIRIYNYTRAVRNIPEPGFLFLILNFGFWIFIRKFRLCVKMSG